ncbi:MAG: preprotein translocase subunit SecG, partial [Verrucomicrobiota bacterium]
MLSIFINLLLFVHVLVCLLIVGVVLMQRPKNEGLGAAFGAGTTDALFGAQTSNVLASITRWLTGIFFGLTLLLSALYARQGREKTGVEQRLQESAQPIAPSIPTIPNEPLKSPATELSPNLPPGGSIPVPAVPEVPVPQVPAETKPAPTPDVPKAEPTAPSAPAPVKPPEPEVTKPSAPPV